MLSKQFIKNCSKFNVIDINKKKINMSKFDCKPVDLLVETRHLLTHVTVNLSPQTYHCLTLKVMKEVLSLYSYGNTPTSAQRLQ